MRRWRVVPGELPQALIAVAGISGAALVWPSDLSWALVAIAGAAVLSLFSFEVELADPEDNTTPREPPMAARELLEAFLERLERTGALSCRAADLTAAIDDTLEDS